MNEKGEVSLLCTLLIFTCMSIVLLCGLELRKSFKLLEKRTELFLCVKETKGELHQFMTFMGRSNWGIKNIHRAALIMLFIPGLQGAAMNTQKLKKLIKYAQDVRVISYLKALHHLKQKSCPLDPRMFITPFKLGTRLLKRDAEGAAQLREKSWNYYYFSRPYFLSLRIEARHFEQINPKLTYLSEEKGAKLSSLLSSR